MPATAWSASQGWVCSESRPVSSVPSSPARRGDGGAEQRVVGGGQAERPASARRRRSARASSAGAGRRRWAGRRGGRRCRRRRPAQSTATPAAWAAASAPSEAPRASARPCAGCGHRGRRSLVAQAASAAIAPRHRVGAELEEGVDALAPQEPRSPSGSGPPRGRGAPSTRASAARSASRSSPVRLETTGIAGALKVELGGDLLELRQHRLHRAASGRRG